MSPWTSLLYQDATKESTQFFCKNHNRKPATPRHQRGQRVPRVALGLTCPFPPVASGGGYGIFTPLPLEQSVVVGSLHLHDSIFIFHPTNLTFESFLSRDILIINYFYTINCYVETA